MRAITGPRFRILAIARAATRAAFPRSYVPLEEVSAPRTSGLGCARSTLRNRAAMSSDRMLALEKDRLATQLMEHWSKFQEALSSQKRRYPTREFEVFWSAAKRYAELTRIDPLIHRAVAAAVNGLVDLLEVERKRVPADVLRDAERLECLLFSGYDPYFEGDEPPGL